MCIMEFFERGCAIAPDGVCLTDGARSLTYAQVRRGANQVAHALRREGLDRGAIVAVYGHNHLNTLVIALGLLRAGCVWLPLNTRNGLDEIRHALTVNEADFLFYHSALGDNVDAVTPSMPRLRGIVPLDRDHGGRPGLEAWLADVGDGDVDLRGGPDDVLAIKSTGGTTGPSKGVMVTGRAYATMYASMLACLPITERPVHLAAAPLSHAAGTLCFPMMAFGGSTVIMEKADPAAMLAAFAEHEVSHIFLTPTMLYTLLDAPTLRDHDYGALRTIVYSGAPMSVDRLKEAMAAFGPVLAQGFGQAEAPFFCTILSPEDHVAALAEGNDKRLASCGRATPFVRLAIMDGEGRLLPDGETGELVVRGDIVMKGYYKNPEATAAASTHGWHHTGDVGYRDAEGYYTIVDRTRDLIISGGFNIAPSEIERVLWSHPAVSDCAVVGVPDPKWGEAVKAVVELRRGQAVSEGELTAFCRERLGGMKTPKSIEFWPELPRSAVGKVMKREVRSRFWADQARQV